MVCIDNNDVDRQKTKSKVQIMYSSTILAALSLLAISPVRPDDSLGEEYGGGYGGYGGDPYGGMGGYGGGYGGYGGYGDEYGYGGDTTPPFTLLEDVESVKKFLSDEDTEPAVIGFFNQEQHASDIQAFENVAAANKYDIRFAYSTNDDVRTHFKAKGMRVDVYKPPRFVSDKFDKPKARYPGTYIDEGALTKFFKKSALPLVGQKTWKSNDRYESSGLPVLTLFTTVDLEKNAKGFDYFANRLRKAAEEHKGKLLFNIGDKSDFAYMLEDYDLELPEKADVGVGIKFDNQYYKMVDSFSVDNLKAFIDSYLAGSLTPKIKEIPEPVAQEDEEEDDGTPSSVVTLTEDNFNEVVMAEGKDVMVEFYAPWCGHCMQLKPVYKKVAAAFEGVDSVTVAAMDATAHEVPSGFDVQGYPTVLFLPDGAKDKPISYEEARDFQSMVNFIKANAAVAIKDEL